MRFTPPGFYRFSTAQPLTQGSMIISERLDYGIGTSRQTSTTWRACTPVLHLYRDGILHRRLAFIIKRKKLMIYQKYITNNS